jgi:hypothetical protein
MLICVINQAFRRGGQSARPDYVEVWGQGGRYKSCGGGVPFHVTFCLVVALSGQVRGWLPQGSLFSVRERAGPAPGSILILPLRIPYQ